MIVSLVTWPWILNNFRIEFSLTHSVKNIYKSSYPAYIFPEVSINRIFWKQILPDFVDTENKPLKEIPHKYFFLAFIYPEISNNKIFVLTRGGQSPSLIY